MKIVEHKPKGIFEREETQKEKDEREKPMKDLIEETVLQMKAEGKI